MNKGYIHRHHRLINVAQRMLDMLHDARLETVPGIGHAPTLDEEPVRRAIDGFLAGVSAQSAAS